MTHRDPIAKTFAILLAVALPLAFVPSTSAQQASGASGLTGTIYNTGAEAPLDGAVLHAADMRTGDIYSSDRTGASGEFTLQNLPPAAYELAIEAEGGLFVVRTPVEIAPGMVQDLQLSVYPDAAMDPESATRQKKSMWDRPLIATLFVIGGAFAFGALISGLDDENQDIASPFSMTQQN